MHNRTKGRRPWHSAQHHARPVDPVDLTAALIRCPSVTPEEGGALVLLQELLEGAGSPAPASIGAACPTSSPAGAPRAHARTFGFNGHTDVVPVGDEAAWTMPPFGAEIKDGDL